MAPFPRYPSIPGVNLPVTYAPPVSSLPDSARFALWFSAFAAKETSLDEARDAIVGDDAAHDVRGLGPDLESLILALGRLRAEGATGAGIALPVPGDPLGLAGPPEFNAAALDVEQAVVLTGIDLGLIPVRAGAGVVWDAVPARAVRQLPDPSEADTMLRQALVRAADDLAALDVARWRPEVADELMALRRPHDLALPGGTTARAGRMLGLATRCRTIVELALADDGGAISAHEVARRREALLPLDHAARRALVAACSFSREG
jgi:hypothetical protein